MSRSRPALLFVVNFRSNTGFAWDNIERFFGRVADRLSARGVRTFVAYPRMPEPPRVLTGTDAEPVELDARLGSLASARATLGFVRREGVRVLYLTDRPAWSHWYVLIRTLGRCRIVVHDRKSGGPPRPPVPKRLLKWLLVRVPGLLADVVIAVSEFVRRRQLRVGLVPADRVVRIYNGFDPAERESADEPSSLRRELGIAPDRPVAVCACRASPEKGVHHLLRAFDRVVARWPCNARPALVFLGNGPQMEELDRLRHGLDARDDIILGGYRPRAVRRFLDASVFAVPSVWQDAFPSSVLEPMAYGKAVVATAVGGIPEMIVDGRTGLLVPPGDEVALADALESVLRDPALAARLGAAARERVASEFSFAAQLDRTVELLERRTDLLDPRREAG